MDNNQTHQLGGKAEAATDTPKLTEFAEAVRLVFDERVRQNAKWGKQIHNDFVWLGILTEEVGELAQAALHDRFGGKAAGMLSMELIHVAAVAVQWIESLIAEAKEEKNSSIPDAEDFHRAISFDGHAVMGQQD